MSSFSITTFFGWCRELPWGDHFTGKLSIYKLKVRFYYFFDGIFNTEVIQVLPSSDKQSRKIWKICLVFSIQLLVEPEAEQNKLLETMWTKFEASMQIHSKRWNTKT